MDRLSARYEVYAGQFETRSEPLHIALPREEIVAEMLVAGERETLDAVCVAVAVVVDALSAAVLEAC